MDGGWRTSLDLQNTGLFSAKCVNYYSLSRNATDVYRFLLGSGLRVLFYYGERNVANNYEGGSRFADSLGLSVSRDINTSNIVPHGNPQEKIKTIGPDFVKKIKLNFTHRKFAKKFGIPGNLENVNAGFTCEVLNRKSKP